MSGSTTDVEAGAPTFAEAVRTWAYVAINSFGGPAGQIAVMHRVVVDEKRWTTEERFLHALNYCMLLPGPEAQQLATYLGWLMHGTRGALAAGGLFVLPGFLVMLGLSFAYALWHQTGPLQAVFYGLKPAVLAVVAEAVLRIGRRALTSTRQRVLAVLAFAAIFLLDVPFPLIVLGAGLIGYATARGGPVPEPAEVVPAAPPFRRTARVLAVGMLIWLGPILALTLLLGGGSVFAQQGWFFSRAAVVTFGGAYAVLGYLAQRAVETYGWVRPAEMIDGLGLAETTPGPLILVVQFVAFLGAWRDPGPFSPAVAAVLGSLVAVWATFAPSFVWILAGAPYVERLRRLRGPAGALAAITAAVVGVVVSLGVWFAAHVLFGRVAEQHVGPLRLLTPDVATLDPAALGIAVLAGVLLLRLHWSMFATLGAGVAAGLVVRALGWG